MINCRLINYVRERIIWLKCFLPILFAHKPLCERFNRDHIVIKGVVICRSCLILYVSFGISIIAYWSIGLVSEFWQLTVASSFFFGIIILSHPKLYAFYPRILRDFLRCVLGFALSLPIGLWIIGYWFYGIIYGVILLIFKMLYSYNRSKKQEKVCFDCDEYGIEGFCSGFEPKVRCMRNYEQSLKDESVINI